MLKQSIISMIGNFRSPDVFAEVRKYWKIKMICYLQKNTYPQHIQLGIVRNSFNNMIKYKSITLQYKGSDSDTKMCFIFKIADGLAAGGSL